MKHPIDDGSGNTERIFQRRLFLVRQLIRGPARARELIDATRAAFDAAIYPLDASRALRRDLAALRTEFDCTIRFTPERGYLLEDMGRLALLDLPDAEIDALGLLQASLTDGRLPNAPPIEALLDRVFALLPAERRRQLERGPAHRRLEQANARSAEEVQTLLKRAQGRHYVIFDYRATYAPSDKPVRHRVAPYDLIDRDGYVYLDAFCHEADGVASGKYKLYRLDRIVAASLHVLPARLPVRPPPRRVYHLRYWLSPAVASRPDTALWFPDCQVHPATDGSATVEARTDDLWQARQILLHYREHCRVLEPPELIDMLRESIARMARLYALEQHPEPAALRKTPGADDERPVSQ